MDLDNGQRRTGRMSSCTELRLLGLVFDDVKRASAADGLVGAVEVRWRVHPPMSRWLCPDSVVRDRSWMDGSFAVAFFFQAEDGIRDVAVTGVQTCALPI